MENIEFLSDPQQWREEVKKKALCFFTLDPNPSEPEAEDRIQEFLSSVFGDSFDSFTVESFLLTCESNTNGESIVEDTRQDLIAHCDGILLDNPPKWICIYKTTQVNITGNDISLLSSQDLITELTHEGISLDHLLEAEFPYKFPKYHKKYRDDLEPTWIPFLREEQGTYFPRYAPDVIQRDLLTPEQSTLLAKIEKVIVRLQKRNAVELPVGSGYLVSNEQYLHGRNALSVMDTSTSGERSVYRIRLYN